MEIKYSILNLLANFPYNQKSVSQYIWNGLLGIDDSFNVRINYYITISIHIYIKSIPILKTFGLWENISTGVRCWFLLSLSLEEAVIVVYLCLRLILWNTLYSIKASKQIYSVGFVNIYLDLIVFTWIW